MRRHLLAVALAATAGCSYDATAPYRGSDPPPPPPVQSSLWIASGITPSLLRLDSAQLHASGSVRATVTVTTPDAVRSTLSGIAFDRAGTLWVASADDSLLLAFSPAALAASGSRAADVVISPVAGSLSAPAALAFDRHHRLWVANFGNGTLVRFDSAQLAAGGALVPAVTLEGPTHPAALAFDSSGTLWVADIRANRLAAYTAAQLEHSGAPVPAIVLRPSADHSLTIPSAIAFDAAGNLWVSCIGSSSLESFGPLQLAASGTPTPRVRLTTNARAVNVPIGLALDDAGALWLLNGDGSLVRFAREQLATSGAPDPATRLQLDRAVVWGLAFWPAPAGLPLH